MWARQTLAYRLSADGLSDGDFGTNQVVRLLLHASMVAGAAASGAEWADKAELLANKAYADPASHERGVQGYVLAHFMQVRRGLGATVSARVGGGVRGLKFLCVRVRVCRTGAASGQ